MPLTWNDILTSRRECRVCGHTCTTADLARPDYLKLSLPGVSHVAPGDCEPEEFETRCPECGAIESFEDSAGPKI